ncbi:dihydrofolate reductase family protein [Streptomyces resistomycificus]|uniref:Deaminase/reductase n=1 Tax=Streptomyces resistomycificus TaxID=67356 RepID=A0A0L8L575_9ACTN|nr:dihydrofolate reductase family protein [Streptomyces resistomycificus]KOG33249.1 deaminase/reductase [Streptomyces resistomycificus]KUN99444.1 deaminase [Streptomyces resistomycificus]
MSDVIAQLSMSLDGYVAGPGSGREHPLGIGGERLHRWVFGLRSWRAGQGLEGGRGGPEDELLADWIARPGAVVMGHGMYVTGELPWGDDPPFHMPVHVVTHHPREPLVKQGGTTFHFVTQGPGHALALAREAAGDKDVSLAGGADLVQQFIRAGWLDELWLHVVPVFVGGGRRLFDGLGDQPVEWRPTQVLDGPEATHIRLRAV